MKNLSILLALLALQAVNARAEQHIEIEGASQAINVEGTAANTSAGISGSNEYVLTAKQIMVRNETIETVSTVCDNVEGNGKEGNWNGFYTVSASEKAAALRASIKGVGAKISPLLVPYFEAGKPHSWSEFSSLIQRAESELSSQGKLNAGWSNQVLNTFASENMSNLGYGSSQNCRKVVTETPNNSRTQVGELTALVKVKISNISLLPGESESMTIAYDGKAVSVSASSSFNQISARVNYNEYANHYDTTATASIAGTARLQVTPANLVDNSRSSISNNGDLILSHSGYSILMSNSEFASKCKAIASSSVTATAGSFWNSKDRATAAGKDIELNLAAGQTSASLGNLGLSEKEKASVNYTVRFAPGCPFFNTAPSLQSVIGL